MSLSTFTSSSDTCIQPHSFNPSTQVSHKLLKAEQNCIQTVRRGLNVKQGNVDKFIPMTSLTYLT